MTAVQLPAHLANRQVRSLTERASEGMGSSLPPHISIQGNSFTFIDAAGNEYQPVLTFDATIVDVSDVMCKQYFDKIYDPNQSTYEPPACWSANGIAPSREAVKPQASLCGECPHNKRGSKISTISGASMKACRDERWIAVLVPQMPQMIFQLRITPGSFKTWKSYTEQFRNYGVELSLGLTRFSFQPKTNGVLLFEHVGWVDEATIGAVEAANREKKTDALVGRTDQPRTALTAPTQQATLPPPNQFQQDSVSQGHTGDGGGMQFLPTQEVIPPQQPPAATPQVPFPVAGAVPFPAPTQAIQPTAAPSAATAAEQAAPRRRRRTNAEIAAANSQAQPVAQPAIGGQQTFIPATAPQSTLQPAAPHPPFPVGETAAPAPAQPQFGMAPGAPINPEMVKMLADMGFVRQQA